MDGSPAASVKDCQHRRVTRDTDPDSVYCIDCFHTVSLLKPLDLPLLHSEPFRSGKADRKDLEPSLCVDCHADITRGAKRCKTCAGIKNLTGANKPGKPMTISHRAFGEQPLTPSRHDYVTAQQGSGR